MSITYRTMRTFIRWLVAEEELRKSPIEPATMTAEVDDSDLPPDLQRWSFGNCSFLTPTDWREAGDQDDTGFAIVPPTGEGRLVVTGIIDKEPPPFGRDYAFDVVGRVMVSLGFEGGDYQFDQMADDHYRAIGESSLRGRFVIAAAHAYAPGNVVIAYYHAVVADQYRPTAWSILNSIAPDEQAR